MDYYEVDSGGGFTQIAQTRQCAGACSDVVEGIARRDVKTIIVAGVSPGSLLKFKNAGIRVLKANSQSVRKLMEAFATNSLEEIGIDQFSKLRR